MQKKGNHGGKRPGSGRPKKPKTVTLSFRVPEAKSEIIKQECEVVIKANL